MINEFGSAFELYHELEIEDNATYEDIKKAYRQKSIQYHPDKNPGHEENFQRIHFAYQVLSDHKLRIAYDDSKYKLNHYIPIGKQNKKIFQIEYKQNTKNEEYDWVMFFHWKKYFDLIPENIREKWKGIFGSYEYPINIPCDPNTCKTFYYVGRELGEQSIFLCDLHKILHICKEGECCGIFGNVCIKCWIYVMGIATEKRIQENQDVHVPNIQHECKKEICVDFLELEKDIWVCKKNNYDVVCICTYDQCTHNYGQINNQGLRYCWISNKIYGSDPEKALGIPIDFHTYSMIGDIIYKNKIDDDGKMWNVDIKRKIDHLNHQIYDIHLEMNQFKKRIKEITNKKKKIKVIMKK